MSAYHLDEPATDALFDEAAYLRVNPDVERTVREGSLTSGRHHYDRYGCNEKPSRMMRMTERIREAKRRKLERIVPLLLPDVPAKVHGDHVDLFTNLLEVERIEVSRDLLPI